MANNIFENLPPATAEEVFETLVDHAPVRIERIVSRGHASPDGFWYDQPHGEFVVLMSGAATIRLEDEQHTHNLRPGDWINIPAHVRHRVEETAAGEPTIWLAVHYDNKTE